MIGKYGLASFILAITGILLFYLSSQDSNGIFNFYLFTGILSWITSFVFGIKGFKTKESRTFIFFGMGIISLLVIGYALVIVIYGIRGFGA